MLLLLCCECVCVCAYVCVYALQTAPLYSVSVLIKSVECQSQTGAAEIR